MSAPERIYLQACDDPDCDECEMVSGHEGQTWCVDRINEHDVEYVRADLVRDAERAAYHDGLWEYYKGTEEQMARRVDARYPRKGAL